MSRFQLAVLLLVVLSAPKPVRAQHPPVGSTGAAVEGADFRVYDGRGRSKSFAEVIAAVEEVDAVLVGETHDDAVGHRVETELLVRAAQRIGAVGGEPGQDRPLVLSLEMFERDVQVVVDEYLRDLITEDQFHKNARPWDRYQTDYRPMVEFARAHELPIVAANAPRRYVNLVSRMGPASLGALSDEARVFLPPLPYPGPSEAYAEQWNALMAEMMEAMSTGSDAGPGEEADTPTRADSSVASGSSTDVPPAPDREEEQMPAAGAPMHGMGNALQAQALWDAAMGEAVAEALGEHPGALVMHYVGSFHVAYGTGVPERVQTYRPGTRTLTVVIEPASDIDAWDEDEHEGLADFVILTRKPPEESPHP